MSRLIRVFAWLIGALVIVVVGGAVYQWFATSRDEARFPMPGRLVDIGGRSLHLWCSGSGPVTVLLENGLTANYTAWLLVQPAIAGFTRVCSYDRAGIGYSDASPNPTQAQFVADDLQQLRNAAGIGGPVVLVGWSAGGVFIRRYQHDHPGGVTGMVFVDSSHEQQRNRLPTLAESASMERQLEDRVRFCETVAWSGLVRVLGTFDALAESQKMAPLIRPAFVAMSNRTGCCGAIAKEMRGFQADVAQPDPPAQLGDLPIVVLTRGRKSSADDLPYPVPQDYLDEQDRVWAELQDELAHLSTRSSHRIATGSGHGIPLEAPGVVVTAVRDIIEGRL